MTRSLPTSPSFKHLRLEAKNILKAHRRGETSCCDTLRRLHQLQDKPDEDVLAAEVGLQEVQFAMAMDYGFESWDDLKRRVLGRDQKSFLHVHCGYEADALLRNSSIQGEIVLWHDPLLEGPTPAGLTDEEWLIVRAEYHVTAGNAKTINGNLYWQRQQHQPLAAFAEYQEVVFWFDPCLFDQTILIRHLDWFGKRELGGTKLSLIHTGEVSGRDRYKGQGLAELDPEELPALLDSRQEITPQQLSLGARAWAAYCSPDPTEVEKLIAGDTSVLPHLGRALLRHLQRFPSVENGLCRMEQEMLQVLADGPCGSGQVFTRLSAMDSPPFFGEGIVGGFLDSLCSGMTPLIATDDADLESSKRTFRITEKGRSVLAGESDHIEARGIERWFGGVRLLGEEAKWRWDEAAGCLVEHTAARPTAATGPFLNNAVDDRRIPVIIKDTEPANTLSLDYDGGSAEATGEAIQQIAAFIVANDLTKIGHYTCVYPSDAAPDAPSRVQVAIAENVVPTEGSVRFTQEPALPVAAIVWRRSSGDIQASLALLEQAIQDRGYRQLSSEAFRQIYHNDPTTSEEPLAELQVRLAE